MLLEVGRGTWLTMAIMMISMLNSKVIAAEGEHKASRALRHAAEVKMSIVVNDSAFNVFVDIVADYSV